MIEYSTDDLIARIRDALQYNFPDDQFLDGELEGVIHGLINSVRWTVIRAAREQTNNSQMRESAEGKVTLNEDIGTLETINRFSSRWMDREEIVYRIENTSGLSTEMAEVGLKMIENVVDEVVVKERSEINIITLGRFRAGEQAVEPLVYRASDSTEGIVYNVRIPDSVVYIISLAEGLSIKSSGRSKTLRATGGAAASSGSW